MSLQYCEVKKVEFSFGASEKHADLEFAFECFQEGFANVADTEHLPRTTIEGIFQKRACAANAETVSPKSGGTIGRRAQDHVNV